MYQEDQALVQPGGPHQFPMFRGTGERFIQLQVKKLLMLRMLKQTRAQYGRILLSAADQPIPGVLHLLPGPSIIM